MNIEETKAEISALPKNQFLRPLQDAGEYKLLYSDDLQSLVNDHAALKERLAAYEKIFIRTAVIEFWGNQEIYQHSGSTGIWLIEGNDTEYNSALEAFAALQGRLCGLIMTDPMLEMDAGAGQSDYPMALIFTSSKFIVTAFGYDREHCEENGENMYFEEKLIDGVMHYRTSPDGAWRPYTIKELSRRYHELKAEFARLKAEQDRERKKTEEIT